MLDVDDAMVAEKVLKVNRCEGIHLLSVVSSSLHWIRQQSIGRRHKGKSEDGQSSELHGVDIVEC